MYKSSSRIFALSDLLRQGAYTRLEIADRIASYPTSDTHAQAQMLWRDIKQLRLQGMEIKSKKNFQGEACYYIEEVK